MSTEVIGMSLFPFSPVSERTSPKVGTSGSFISIAEASSALRTTGCNGMGVEIEAILQASPLILNNALDFAAGFPCYGSAISEWF